MELRYEDFVEVPDSSLRHILEVSGLCSSPRAESYVHNKGRYKNMNRHNISILTKHDLNVVRAILGPCMEPLGYRHTDY